PGDADREGSGLIAAAKTHPQRADPADEAGRLWLRLRVRPRRVGCVLRPRLFPRRARPSDVLRSARPRLRAGNPQAAGVLGKAQTGACRARELSRLRRRPANSLGTTGTLALPIGVAQETEPARNVSDVMPITYRSPGTRHRGWREEAYRLFQRRLSMRKLLTAAAVALISNAAQAEVHEFRFGGSTWRVEISSNCRDIACVRVSEERARARKAAKPVKSARPSEPVVARKVAAPKLAAPKAVSPEVATPVVPAPPPVAPAAAAPPAAVAAMPPRIAPGPEPRIEFQPTDDRRQSLLIVEDATPAPQLAAVEPRSEPDSAEPSPLGVWLTEKGEGRVRIEPCGPALCGYADG